MKRILERIGQTSFRQLITKNKEIIAQKSELQYLQNFASDASSLIDVKITASHPLLTIANAAKTIVDNNNSQTVTVEQISNLKSFFDKQELSALKLIENEKYRAETLFRVNFAKHYFSRLSVSHNETDLDCSKFSKFTMYKVIDASLLGTSSERIAEHIALYGPKLTQSRLQDCLYSLFEPEIETCSGLLVASSKGIYKHHLKEVPKLAKTYLLDKMELNMKTRCVIAWSDPTYTGFKPLPDDHSMTVADLVKSRQTFFKEAASVGQRFVAEVVLGREQHFEDRLERRETIYLGSAFFVATCLMDWAVCSL